MKKGLIIFIIALLSFVFLPLRVFAVDFTIPKTEINAYLLEDGNVSVEEKHTYEFDGSFNGITRHIIPKEDTEINDFKGSENGNPLEVEPNDEEYRIYRSGEDETITIDISYTIADGVEVYEDMAQFHWPFFDTSNESDYENMTITVHPPQPANETIAFGYDAAYNSENIKNDGAVEFQLGFVESGEKGDIRVGYEQSLFTHVSNVHAGTMQEELIQEKEELDENYVAFIERRNWLQNTAPYVISAFGLFFLLLIIYAWRKRQSVKLEVDRTYNSTSPIPKPIMSMPATVFYYKNFLVPYGDMLTVAMMDLARKGNIVEQDKNQYYLANNKTNHIHETHLIELLFEEIGENHTFSFEQLKNYTEDSENQQTLQTKLHAYIKSIREEIKAQHLRENKSLLRWFTGLISLLLIPYMFILGYHDLFMWVFLALLSMIGLLSFAVVYHPRTVEGEIIKRKWKTFESEYEDMETSQWKSLSEDDQQRALIFSTGLNDKKLAAKNKTFMEQLSYADTGSPSSLFLMLFVLSTTGNQSFQSTTETSAAASGGSYAGTGTGVGGGGGGSGAF